jgi:hypothetical protein
MIIHKITYQFLNVDCEFETEYLTKLFEKFEYLLDTPEVLQHKIRFQTIDNTKEQDKSLVGAENSHNPFDSALGTINLYK